MASLTQMAATVLPIVGPMLVRGFDTNEKIGRVKAPLLIIHGDFDEVVPFTQGEGLFRSAKEPKTFWPVAGAHHNDLIFVAGSEYVLRLRMLHDLLETPQG